MTGGRETTWTHKGKKQTLWPRDLLPEDIPRARIITFGYDADVASFGLSVAGSNRLRDHGNNLASDVATFREKTDTPTKRPIIFVAHSLGGLVVEQVSQIPRADSVEAFADIDLREGFDHLAWLPGRLPWGYSRSYLWHHIHGNSAHGC